MNDYNYGGSPYNTMGVKSTGGGGGGGGFGSFLGGLGGGNVAMLIPSLIGIGLEFFTSRKAAKSIRSRSYQLLAEGLMRESKYTGSIEAYLEGAQDRYNKLFKTMWEGMPKDPTYEKIFGDKDYGFTFETPEPEKPMTDARFRAMSTEEKKAWVKVHGPWHYS